MGEKWNDGNRYRPDPHHTCGEEDAYRRHVGKRPGRTLHTTRGWPNGGCPHVSRSKDRTIAVLPPRVREGHRDAQQPAAGIGFQRDACTWRIQTAEFSPAGSRGAHGRGFVDSFWCEKSAVSHSIPWCLNFESNQNLIGNSRSDHRSGEKQRYWGCVGYRSTLVCIYQLVSNYRLIRFKNFVSWFSTKLYN
jgi:hypothetical protein